MIIAECGPAKAGGPFLWDESVLKAIEVRIVGALVLGAVAAAMLPLSNVIQYGTTRPWG